ncbi:MAG: hypothetical protein ACXWTY_02600 [Methylobacter sp.]
MPEPENTHENCRSIAGLSVKKALKIASIKNAKIVKNEEYPWEDCRDIFHQGKRGKDRTRNFTPRFP